MSATVILLAVIAVAVVVLTIFLVRMIQQLVKTAAEVERLTRSLNDDLLPRIERVMGQTEAELVEIRVVTKTAQNITASVERVVGSVTGLVGRVENAIHPAVELAEGVGSYARQGTAVLAGVRAGLAAFRKPPKAMEPEEVNWGI